MTPCALCGSPATGSFGYRVGDMRHVACTGCTGLSAADVRARLLARHVPKPASSPKRPKRPWVQRGARCAATVGCLLLRTHHGKCYSGNEL